MMCDLRMSKRKKDDPPLFVRIEDCREKHLKVDKIELALFGEDGRGGMVNDISKIKNYINGHKESGRGWKNLGFTIVGGLTIFVISYVLSRIL